MLSTETSTGAPNGAVALERVAIQMSEFPERFDAKKIVSWSAVTTGEMSFAADGATSSEIKVGSPKVLPPDLLAMNRLSAPRRLDEKYTVLSSGVRNSSLSTVAVMELTTGTI